MRPLPTWLTRLALSAAVALVIMFVIGRLVGSCGGKGETTPAQHQADSLVATRRDFLERQRRYDSVLIVQTRRADSVTLEARAMRVVASARGRKADSLARLQDWHAAYNERTVQVTELLASIAKDSLAAIERQKGADAILTSKLELRERLRVTEEETIPGLRKDIRDANARAARQRWAGRIEGFSTGAFLGAIAGAVTASLASK